MDLKRKQLFEKQLPESKLFTTSKTKDVALGVMISSSRQIAYRESLRNSPLLKEKKERKERDTLIVLQTLQN